jgi:hypothetical protein
MPIRSHAVPHAILKPLAVLAGLAVGGSAFAQQSPWYIGVSQGFTHYSNVYRQGAGQEVSDTVSSTGVLGGLNLELGRQRVFADFTANSNRYQDQDQQNNNSYSLSTGLDWQTIEHLSGNVRLTGRRNLGDYGVGTLPAYGVTTPVRNVETIRQASASVRYAMLSYLAFTGGVSDSELKYSFTTERDTSSKSAHAGLVYGTPGSLLNLGVSGRVTKGETPRYRQLLDPLFPNLGFGPVEPDESDRKDIDFTVIWTASALSTVTGRISATREDHTAPSRSDFSGVTGEVEWSYKPSDKLAVQTSIARDTGSQTTFTRLQSTDPFPTMADQNRVNWVFGVDAKYALTAKVSLNGSLQHTRGDVDVVSGRSYQSRSNQFALGANYQVLRTLSLGCNLTRETRRAYGANVAGCSAQFVLR